MLGQRVTYSDLLSRGFAIGGRGAGPLDCAGVVEEILRRAGLIGPEESVFPVVHDEESATRAAVVYLRQRVGRWHRLGSGERAATEVGDVVASGLRDGNVRHVSVLVNPEARGFLTSIAACGVVCVRGSMIANVEGAYRWGGAP